MTPWGEVVTARRSYEQSIGAELRAHESFLADRANEEKRAAWQASMQIKGFAYRHYREAFDRALKSGIPRPK